MPQCSVTSVMWKQKRQSMRNVPRNFPGQRMHLHPLSAGHCDLPEHSTGRTHGISSIEQDESRFGGAIVCAAQIGLRRIVLEDDQFLEQFDQRERNTDDIPETEDR